MLMAMAVVGLVAAILGSLLSSYSGAIKITKQLSYYEDDRFYTYDWMRIFGDDQLCFGLNITMNNNNPNNRINVGGSGGYIHAEPWGWKISTFNALLLNGASGAATFAGRRPPMPAQQVAGWQQDNRYIDRFELWRIDDPPTPTFGRYLIHAIRFDSKIAYTPGWHDPAPGQYYNGFVIARDGTGKATNCYGQSSAAYICQALGRTWDNTDSICL